MLPYRWFLGTHDRLLPRELRDFAEYTLTHSNSVNTFAQLVRIIAEMESCLPLFLPMAGQEGGLMACRQGQDKEE